MIFDQNKAKDADNGGGITESGVYVGIIQNMKVVRKDSGATFVEFEFEAESNGTARFLSICTRKRDNTEAFGYNKMITLMGILGLKEANLIGDTLPDFCGRKCAIALQKEYYVNKKGDTKYKMNPLHFFYYDTKQTYGERADNKDAKIYLRKIEDKLPKNFETNIVDSNQLQQSQEDDLPF